MKRLNAASDLAVGWKDYYDLIARQERRTLANGFEIHVFDHPSGSYLQEADNCQDAFNRYGSLSAMSAETRKLVSGWGKRTYGYFGRMSGAGYFKKMTSNSPELLDEHLSMIAAQGPVSTKRARSYLSGITQLHGVSLGSATRLLTVKRPDLFLTFNNANSRRIREVFREVSWSIKGYIELHEEIWKFPWFKVDMPEGGDELRVWERRVALLDALLYQLPDYQQPRSSNRS